MQTAAEKIVGDENPVRPGIHLEDLQGRFHAALLTEVLDQHMIIFIRDAIIAKSICITFMALCIYVPFEVGRNQHNIFSNPVQ